MSFPKDLHWISNVPLGITICIFGIVGNSFSVYIWRRIVAKNHQFCHSTAMYLFTLGGVDVGLLIFFILSESISAAEPNIKKSFSYTIFFAWFSYPISCVLVVGSIWLIVGVTINRWVLVAYPLRSRTFYTMNNTSIGLAIIAIFALLVNVPHWFKFRVIPALNGTSIIENTAFGSSDGFVRYEFWCHCMVLVLVPWLTIAILNILIVKKLRDRIKKISFVSKRPRGMKEDRNLTAMLLIMTFSFLVLIAWQCISQCLYMIMYGEPGTGEPKTTKKWQHINNSYAFGKLGVVINSATNWMIYGIFGQRFRTEVKEVVSLWHENVDVTAKTKSIVSTITDGKGDGSIKAKLTIDTNV